MSAEAGERRATARRRPNRSRPGPLLWAGLATFVVLTLVGAAGLIWRDDILEALLDPKIPYAVYSVPAAPDYASASAWARLPEPVGPGSPAADVFFIHPTTFDGGRDWNGPVGDRAAARRLARVVLPNYAAPFASVARVFVPEYRQASLYTSLTLFDDALQARAFAFGDIQGAFRSFLARIGPDRPFLVVGVEQGGELGARLLTEDIAPDARLRRRLVAAYLIDTVTPADEHEAASPVPACARRDQWGCVVAWIAAPRLDFVRVHRIMSRSVVWTPDGRLVGLSGRAPLCVNPLLGAASEADAPARLNLGAANATGLEWGVRPGFMARQVAARCEAGVLRVTGPRSALLRPSGDWAGRLREPGFNLFWADLEADATRRLAAWQAREGSSTQPAAASGLSARQSNRAFRVSRARPRDEA